MVGIRAAIEDETWWRDKLLTRDTLIASCHSQLYGLKINAFHFCPKCHLNIFNTWLIAITYWNLARMVKDLTSSIGKSKGKPSSWWDKTIPGLAQTRNGPEVVVASRLKQLFCQRRGECRGIRKCTDLQIWRRRAVEYSQSFIIAI